MSDGEIKEKEAGCEKEVKSDAEGRNTHEVFVTLGTVNKGKKNTADGALGTQSTLMLLPVNATSGDENDFMLSETSRIETAVSSKVRKSEALTGSNIFKAQTKLLPGSSKPIGSFMEVEVHVEEFNKTLPDKTTDGCSVKGFRARITSTFTNENVILSSGLKTSRMPMPLIPKT
jgi:hypothetical protein